MNPTRVQRRNLHLQLSGLGGEDVNREPSSAQIIGQRGVEHVRHALIRRRESVAVIDSLHIAKFYRCGSHCFLFRLAVFVPFFAAALFDALRFGHAGVAASWPSPVWARLLPFFGPGFGFSISSALRGIIQYFPIGETSSTAPGTMPSRSQFSAVR